jgi:hypothetical protein
LLGTTGCYRRDHGAWDGAVILEFGRSVAGDLFAFVETAPAEEDDSTGIFELAARRDAPEGEFRSSLVPDLEIGRLDEIKIVPIPQIGLDDPPPADKFASSGAGHGTAAISPGARTKS